MADRGIVREVGLRDRLQLVRIFLPTARKLKRLEGAVAAALPGLEITSFVPPVSIPQFADAEAIIGDAADVGETWLPGGRLAGVVAPAGLPKAIRAAAA